MSDPNHNDDSANSDGPSDNGNNYYHGWLLPTDLKEISPDEWKEYWRIKPGDFRWY